MHGLLGAQEWAALECSRKFEQTSDGSRRLSPNLAPSPPDWSLGLFFEGELILEVSKRANPAAGSSHVLLTHTARANVNVKCYAQFYGLMQKPLSLQRKHLDS